eukprot:6908464-Lingulodinium_polyedra.AAC.1
MKTAKSTRASRAMNMPTAISRAKVTSAASALSLCLYYAWCKFRGSPAQVGRTRVPSVSCCW